MFRWLYPHHANPRDLGLYPWLEVLKDTERGFTCACCGVKQHWFRPMVFMAPGLDARSSFPSRGLRRVYLYFRAVGNVAPWCVSCAWALCGRQMVRARRWWEFWR